MRIARFAPAPMRRATAGVMSQWIGQLSTPDAGRKAAAGWATPEALPSAYYFTRTLFPPGELARLTEPRFRPSSVSADGVTLEPTWLGGLERTADEAGKSEPVAAGPGRGIRGYDGGRLGPGTD